MDLEPLIPIFGMMIVLVPVTGLTVVLTAKYVTEPIVAALTRLRGGQGYGASGDLHAQVQDLSEQVEVLTGELRRLKEAQAFDRRLLQERARQREG